MPSPSPWEMAAASFEETALSDGLDLAGIAKIIDPNTVQTPALDLIDEALEVTIDTPGGRQYIGLSVQEGKSSRVGIALPVAVLRKRPDTRIIVASYGVDLARRNSEAIRNAILMNPHLGLKIDPTTAAKGEWRIEGHKGGVKAAGVGSAITGRACDLLIIDDPHANMMEAESLAFQERAWSWWRTTAAARLGPGAPVIIISTRWSMGDLPGRLLAAEDGHRWRVLNIPAQADHDPEKGETDPLGREPGEFLTSARGRTVEEWEQIKVQVGSRVWQAMYQGRPSPAEGGLFKRDWWERYDYPLWHVQDNGAHEILGSGFTLCQSWDLTFKDTKESDWVVGQVWLRRGVHAFLLDQVRRRMSFTETLDAMRAMHAKWPQCRQGATYVEDKANGPAVINALYGTIQGLIPVNPEGSKFGRAAAVTVYVEAKNVLIPTPELAPWVEDFVEECAAFPTGTNDDQVDALSQALNRLLLNPWDDAGELIVPDLFNDAYDGYGHNPTISLY